MPTGEEEEEEDIAQLCESILHPPHISSSLLPPQPSGGVTFPSWQTAVAAPTPVFSSSSSNSTSRGCTDSLTGHLATRMCLLKPTLSVHCFHWQITHCQPRQWASECAYNSIHPKNFYWLINCLFSCSKCQQYSPTESNKAYDKAVNRRAGVTFDPRSVLEELKRGPQAPPRSKDYYLQQYVEVCSLWCPVNGGLIWGAPVVPTTDESSGSI